MMKSVLGIAGKKIDFITAGGRVSVSNTLLGHCWVFDSCGELKKRLCLGCFSSVDNSLCPRAAETLWERCGESSEG